MFLVTQVQAGKRTPKAGIKIAVDMVGARLLTEREALLRIDAHKAAFFMHLHLRPEQLESGNPLGECLCIYVFMCVYNAVFTCSNFCRK